MVEAYCDASVSLLIFCETRMTKKVYETHDNGGRPFRVEVEGHKVTVFKNMNTYEFVDGKFVTIEKPAKQILEFTCESIFVGKKSPKGGYDGLKPKEAEGNSLVVKVGAKYIFIGHEIYEFTPIKGDTIVGFYSDIGNSDVPYPYAIGQTHIYILLDKIAVEKSYFDMKGDIYMQYYDGTAFLKECLKGLHQNTRPCKDKEAAKDRIAEVKAKSKSMKTKMLQKRL